MKENNSENKSKKNNKKVINILITIIVLLIIFISSLIVYIVINKDKLNKDDKVKNNKSTNNKQVEPIKENITLSEYEKEELISFINRYKLNYLASKVEGNITRADNRILLNSIYYIDSISSNNISYGVEDIKGYINRVFNINDIEIKDILCPLDNEVLYKYLPDGYIYVLNETHQGHGGELLVDDIAHYVTKAEKIGDKYIIDIIYLYGSMMDGYYVNDEELNVSVDSYIEMTPEEESNYMKDYFFDHIEEFKEIKPYEYTFVKNGNSYYLYSVTTGEK